MFDVSINTKWNVKHFNDTSMHKKQKTKIPQTSKIKSPVNQKKMTSNIKY